MSNAEPYTLEEIEKRRQEVEDRGNKAGIYETHHQWLATLDARDAEIARLEMHVGTFIKVLKYILFVLTRSNEIKADLCDDVQMAVDRNSAAREAIRAVVDEQAKDDGCWFDAVTAPEAYLQQELRRLHAAVEGKGKP